MSYCPPETFELVRPHLYPGLLNRSAVQWTETMIRELPAGASAYAIELRLDDDPQCDLAVALIGTDGGAARYLEQRERITERFSVDDGDRAAWEHCFAFLEAWSSPAGGLGSIPFVWLEFDCKATDALPPPKVFFALSDADVPARARSLERTLGLLRPDLNGGTLETALKLQALLPPGAHVRHAGSELNPESRGLRLVADGLPLELLPAVLQDAGWTGGGREIVETYRKLAPGTPEARINFDIIEETIYSRIGLEICYPESEKKVYWPVCLDALVAAGKCSPERRRALNEWVGSYGFLVRELEPQVLWRTMNHVKLGFAAGAGEVAGAKAYLGWTPGRRPPALGAQGRDQHGYQFRL